MIPKSWFSQTIDDIYKANQRITILLIVSQELENKYSRLMWQDNRLRALLHERTGLSYDVIDDLVWERGGVDVSNQ